MRFGIEILLENEKIVKDKNKIMLSLIKHCYSSYDKEYYNDLYEKYPNKRKSFTFSTYMGDCKFLRDEIFIPNKKIYLNFSTKNLKDGIAFYNALLTNKGKIFPIKNNKMKIERINMLAEKDIYSNEAIMKTMSPIVVRFHKGDNKKTWYYSLNDEKGRDIFMQNLRYQLIEEFGEDRSLDIEEVRVEVLCNKEVKVKNYRIEVLSNICKIKVIAKPYILDYLYKSGIGSKKSLGFGMMELV